MNTSSASSRTKMESEKMHLALPRINNDMLEMQLGGTDSLPRKFHKQKHCKGFTEVHRVSSLAWRNSDDRCSVLTFLTVEPNGQWRIVAVPLHYPNPSYLGSSGLVSMDRLPLVPRLIDSAHAGRQSIAKGAAKSSSILGSAVQRRTQNRASNKTKWKELPTHFHHKVLPSSEYSSADSSSSAIKPESVLITDSSVENATRRGSKKKNKKKAKRGMKNLSQTCSTEPEVLHKDHLNISSVFETCGNNIANHKEKLGEFSPRKEVEMLEQAVLVFHKLPENHSVGAIGKQPQARDSVDAVCVGSKDSNCAQVNNIVLKSSHSSKFCHSSKHWEKENVKAGFPEPPASNFRKPFSDCKSLYSYAVDSCNNVDKTNHAHQDSNGGDLHLATPYRRNVQSKPFSEFSNFCSYRSDGNHRVRIGRENTLAVWKKVQRNSNSDSSGDSKKVPTHSHLDALLEDATARNRYSNDFEHSKKLKDTISSEWRTKTHSASKLKCSHVSESGSHAVSFNSDDSAKVIPSPTEMSCISSSVKDQNVTTDESRSSLSLRVCTDQSDLKRQTIEDLNHSLTGSCNFLDQSKVMHSPDLHPNVFGNPVWQLVGSSYVAESAVQNYNSGSCMQKWKPVGFKDHGLTSSDESSLVGQSNKLISHNTVESKENHDSHNGVPVTQEMSVGRTARDIFRSCKDECETPELEDHQASMRSRQKNIPNAANRSGTEYRVLNVPGSNLDKIAEAVNEAYKLQLASEVVEKLSGFPLAEFERLLAKSSPIIYQPPPSICNLCPRDEFGGRTLCRHEKPNVSLESIWKWYEEIGACGLEVNGDDYNYAKRIGADFFPFSAYFVPYLSAVQLFGNCDNHSQNSSVSVSSSEVLDTCRITEISSVCPKGISSLQSVAQTMSIDSELLFEYFESETPQQRRPLYEKIQQLVCGEGIPQNKGQGDPANLYCVKLKDLHHKSWYSVAWYPIYRIPEGPFRASFLTFHSLGHLTCRSSRCDSKGVRDCIVFPVVGLQSYNAQAECWFNSRSSIAKHVKEIVPGINRSAILKERLRTLEETASLMARSVVRKGNLTSVNHHPDYEFFCSRRRC